MDDKEVQKDVEVQSAPELQSDKEVRSDNNVPSDKEVQHEEQSEESGLDKHDSPGEGAPSSHDNRQYTIASVVLALVSVALLVMSVWAWRDTSKQSENMAFVHATRTLEVKEAARTHVELLVSIDHKNLDQYHSDIKKALTSELFAELDASWPLLRSNYKQSKTSVTSRVTDVGVVALTETEAEVLVIQEVEIFRDQQVSGSASGPYLLRLVKENGVWKLNEIPDLSP